MYCRFETKLLDDIRDAVKTGKRKSYVVFSTSELMESILSTVMYTAHLREIVLLFFSFFFSFFSGYNVAFVFHTTDPEEQPHVSGRGLRVPVAPVDCQPNVQVRHIRGDARVRHHQSQAGIVSACTLINNNDNNNNNIAVVTHWCPCHPKPASASAEPPLHRRPSAHGPRANGPRAIDEKNISDTACSQDAHYLMDGGAESSCDQIEK
jgi:hypothetical protein